MVTYAEILIDDNTIKTDNKKTTLSLNLIPEISKITPTIPKDDGSEKNADGLKNSPYPTYSPLIWDNNVPNFNT